MTALGRRLRSRGHEVVFVGIPDAAARVQAAGLDFLPYCEREFPPDSQDALFGRIAYLRGFEVLRSTIQGPWPRLVEAIRAKARDFGEVIAAANGLEVACDVIERAFGIGDLVGAGSARRPSVFAQNA